MKIACIDFRLGAASSEAVHPRRRDFQHWLCSVVLGETRALENFSPEATIFIPDCDIQLNPSKAYSQICHCIDSIEDNAHLGCILIDLSANAYELLRDTVLFHIAQASKAIHGIESSMVCILLPQMPADNSLLWGGLSDIPDGANICVLATHGGWKWFGAKARDSPRDFDVLISREYRAVTGDVIEIFELKLLRRLGHFVRWVQGHSECSRYFFDAGNCVPEVWKLLQDRIQASIREGSMSSPTAIIVHRSMSSWIREAVLSLGAELGIEVFDTSGNLAAMGVPTGALLITDLVDKDTSLARKIAEIESQGILLQPRVFGAIGRNARLSLRSGERIFLVECLISVEPETVSSEACEQCFLGIPHSSVLGSTPLEISSYDMWWMFSRVRWKPEKNVPPTQDSLGVSPDMEALFGEFGDWIAFLVEKLLRRNGCSDETVVVCPDEDVSEKLIDCLRLRFENRLVPVFIPREMITFAQVNTFENVVARVEAENQKKEPNQWIKQLQGFGANFNRVVVMDEFSGSGGTLIGIQKILQALDIPIFAFFPILDRAPSINGKLGERTLSLYEIDSPRLSESKF